MIPIPSEKQFQTQKKKKKKGIFMKISFLSNQTTVLSNLPVTWQYCLSDHSPEAGKLSVHELRMENWSCRIHYPLLNTWSLLYLLMIEKQKCYWNAENGQDAV